MRGALAILLLLSCSGGSAGSETSSSGATGSTSTSTSSAGVTTMPDAPGACMSTKDCEEDQFCVAPYDGPGAGMGDPVCVPSCVEENELMRWCLDDTACCEGLFCREVDGLCEPPDIPPATETSTSTSTGSSTGG